MGNITLCTYSSTFYDVKTNKQGIIFLFYSIVCLILELFFIVLTVKFFVSNKKLSARNNFLVFYISFHLSLISAILYLAGGVICYNLILYNLFCNFPYLAQAIGVYAITMESFNLVTIAWKTDNPILVYKEIWCSIVLLVYVGGYIGVFWHEINDGELHYFYLYNGIWHIAFSGGYFFISKLAHTEVAEKYPSLLPKENRRVLSGVSCTIAFLMSLRGILTLLSFTGLRLYLRNEHIGLFTLYIIVFVTIFNLFPCIVLAIFMQLYKQTDIQLISVPEIKKAIQTKKVFPKPAKDDLMQEMLNMENAEENWV